MKNTPTPEATEQGSPALKTPPPVETIIKWLEDDLGRARSLLMALHDDPNILRLVAVHLQGKISNHLNAPSQQPNQEK